jgi:two-component system CheB/CheR fusion protein
MDKCKTLKTGKKQATLAAISDGSNDAIIIVDLQGNIKAWSKIAEKNYGYTVKEATQMNTLDMFDNTHRKEIIKKFQNIKKGKEVDSFTAKKVAKNGTVVKIWMTITKLTCDKKNIFIACIERDAKKQSQIITSLKELPKRIILAEEQERSRISQEIHDNFGQSLIALKLFIGNTVYSFMNKDPQIKKSLQ